MRYEDERTEEIFRDAMERHAKRQEHARRNVWEVTPVRRWVAHGLTCYLVATPMCLNGYVSVPVEHPFYGFHYNECPRGCDKDYCEHAAEAVIEVHGGITFSHLGPDGWIFGFDTCHFGDLMITPVSIHEGRLWEENDVAEETARMAQQLAGVWAV